MKKTTLSILLALVIVLSFSVTSVFAQGWDEETVLTVFNDLEMNYPDLFSTDEDALPLDGSVIEFDTNVSKAVSEEDLVSKAAISQNNGTVKGSFDNCGDGTIDLDIEFFREDPATPEYGTEYRGNFGDTYIRDISVDVKIDGTDYKGLSLKDCKSTGGDSCHRVDFNSKGKAKMSGYVQIPAVIESGVTEADVTVNLTFSTYMTVLWPVTPIDVQITGKAKVNEKHDYCQPSLEEFSMGPVPSVRGAYDEHSGEGRIQATIRNFKSYAPKHRPNFVIPGEIMVGDFSTDDYTCKYTLYNPTTGAPVTEYCEYGKAIDLENNGVIRFDIEFKGLGYDKTGDQSFAFRVGGMEDMILGTLKPVKCPSDKVSELSIMDPLKPFMNFFAQDGDDAIKASGPYGVYEGGVWGTYQKCGKFARLMVRVKNTGALDEELNLNNVAVAINGGTPMKFAWVMGTMLWNKNKTILLEPGDEVILIGFAKVTDIPSQLNSDASMTAAVNFLDYGKYVTGELFSDHNNTKCVAP